MLDFFFFFNFQVLPDVLGTQSQVDKKSLNPLILDLPNHGLQNPLQYLSDDISSQALPHWQK